MIRRPVGTSLLALGLALAGIWTYILIGVAALPALEFPGMSVYAEVPGASAQTMASTVAAPLERHLGRIPGIKEMSSESNDGSSSVILLFEPGKSTDKLARDVQAAINAAQVDLPSSMTIPPRYFKFNNSRMPVLLLSMTSTTQSPEKLYDMADTLIAPVLSQIPGVAQVRIMTTNPTTPTQVVLVTAPDIKTTTPTRKARAAMRARRRAEARSVVPRIVDASLGSSATSARSICSSRRSSSSESGTVPPASRFLFPV